MELLLSSAKLHVGLVMYTTSGFFRKSAISDPLHDTTQPTKNKYSRPTTNLTHGQLWDALCNYVYASVMFSLEPGALQYPYTWHIAPPGDYKLTII